MKKITILYIGSVGDLLWYLQEIEDWYLTGEGGRFKTGLGGSTNSIIYNI